MSFATELADSFMQPEGNDLQGTTFVHRAPERFEHVCVFPILVLNRHCCEGAEKFLLLQREAHSEDKCPSLVCFRLDGGFELVVTVSKKLSRFKYLSRFFHPLSVVHSVTAVHLCGLTCFTVR